MSSQTAHALVNRIVMMIENLFIRNVNHTNTYFNDPYYNKYSLRKDVIERAHQLLKIIEDSRDMVDEPEETDADYGFVNPIQDSKIPSDYDPEKTGRCLNCQDNCWYCELHGRIKSKTFHTFYDIDDVKDRDPEDLLFKWVVDGGLTICKTCGLIEGSMTTHCPQKESYKEYGDRVYKGELDFVDGKWVNSSSYWSPFHKEDEEDDESMCDTCSRPDDGVLERIIDDIKKHAIYHYDHGVGCACMDKHAGAIRALYSEKFEANVTPDIAEKARCNFVRILSYIVNNP